MDQRRGGTGREKWTEEEGNVEVERRKNAGSKEGKGSREEGGGKRYHVLCSSELGALSHLHRVGKVCSFTSLGYLQWIKQHDVFK